MIYTIISVIVTTLKIWLGQVLIKSELTRMYVLPVLKVLTIHDRSILFMVFYVPHVKKLNILDVFN